LIDQIRLRLEPILWRKLWIV